MSFLDELDVEEYAEGHEYYASHAVKIDWDNPRDDGKVLAYCDGECEWSEWGHDSRQIGNRYD